MLSMVRSQGDKKKRENKERKRRIERVKKSKRKRTKKLAWYASLFLIEVFLICLSSCSFRIFESQSVILRIYTYAY